MIIVATFVIRADRRLGRSAHRLGDIGRRIAARTGAALLQIRLGAALAVDQDVRQRAT